ncbi:MAG: lipoprotein [Pseudomonadota bacterium]
MPYRAASSVVAPDRRLSARVLGTLIVLASLALPTGLLTGCGQRGPLVLPKAKPTATAAPASAPPSESSAPAR